MKILRNALALLVLLVVFLFGLLFAVYNDQSIALDLILVEIDAMSLPVWSGLLLVVGILLGVLIASLSKVFVSIESRRLKKELVATKAKLAKLAG
jgi:putative membrane protein